MHIGRQDRGAVQGDGTATDFAHKPARLAYQQDARRDVPGLQAPFPKALEATCRDIGKIERCGSPTPDAGTDGHHLLQLLQEDLVAACSLEGNAGGEERFIDPPATRNPDATII